MFNKICALILDSVLNKKLLDNQQIPSIANLSAQLHVSPTTVLRAYDYLQRMGFCYKRRGLGFFISPSALQTARKYRREQFWQKELPFFFNTMLLLNIEFNDLRQYHKQLNFKLKSAE